MSWWAQKLSGQQPSSAPSAPPPVPRRYPPQPQYGSPYTAPSSPPSMHDAPVAPDGKIPAAEALARFRGTQAAQQGSGNCPECGGANYFVMTNTEGVMTARGQVTPKPRCFDCGYPTIQSGSMHGILASARVVGAPRAAKQHTSAFDGFRPDVVVAKVT